MASFGVVVLAAGGSSRLGRPKQLLPYEGKSLVRKAAEVALGSGASEIIVVVGANATAVGEELRGLTLRVVENPGWVEGMGSSIRLGIAALAPDMACAIVALCDQPKVTAAHLTALALRQLETGASIVASSYDGVLGAPCAFGSSMFASLLSLAGDAGARDLIRGSSTPVETVPFSGGRVDVDTLGEYELLVEDRTASE